MNISFQNKKMAMAVMFLMLFFDQLFLSSGRCETHPASLIKASGDGAAAILVDKKSQTLRVYIHRLEADQYEVVLERPCSTGEEAGRKSLEGDKKTPEGVYFVEAIFEDRYLTPVYGKRAFTTDYPNLLDSILGRTGSAIWIHGTNKSLKPMDSNGCVAMNNNDVIKLDQYIIPDETPVIMAEELEFQSLEKIKMERRSVLEFVERWRTTLNSGTYHEFLSYYSEGYLPDMEWWMPWSRLRNSGQFRAKGQEGEVLSKKDAEPLSFIADVARVGIYRQGEQFVVLFDLLLASADPSHESVTVGKRKIFIEPRTIAPDDDMNTSSVKTDATQLNYQIIGDRFQVVSIKAKQGEAPLVAAAEGLHENGLPRPK